MKELLIIMVKVYQTSLSPFLGGRCRYVPTCSDYMLEALHEGGASKGFLLGIKRIIRCHPWGGHGHDPIPTTLKGNSSSL